MERKFVVLVIEDDADINHLLCTILSKSGYEAIAAYSGSEGMMLFNSRSVDLILLDLMLPGITGEALLAEIRKTSKIPAIVISAKSNTLDKVGLLKGGADDYIVKPFDMEEVLARVEALLRRYLGYRAAGPIPEAVLTHKAITLDVESHEVRVNGSPVSLTAKEYAILALLMKYPKKVFTKQNLFESIWGDEYLSDENTINVHISNLRNKLSKEEDFIQTLWGIGYKMSD